MTRLARLTLSALVAGIAVVSCARAPEAGLEDQAAQNPEVMPGWLEGKARFHRSFAKPVFGVSVRLRGSDFSAIDAALGVNNPCFSLALVQKCANGVSGVRLTPISVQLFCDFSGFDSVRYP